MPVVWYLYIFFICQLFVYLEAKMSTNWHFWRLLKMQTNSCSFVNKHHKNFLSGYFFIPYVYLNFDRKKKLEVHGMSRSLRHLQLSIRQCMHLRKNAWIWEKMHEFHRRVGIGKCLRFSYTYIKIAIEILEKLKSRIENAGMYCSIEGRWL